MCSGYHHDNSYRYNYNSTGDYLSACDYYHTGRHNNNSL